MHRISFPFLYLDSSALFRSEIDPKVLTRKIVQNEKKVVPLLIDQIITLSNQEDIYYKNICSLISNNIINKVITCETINKEICNSDKTKTIFLFGIKPMKMTTKLTNEWVLWSEEISHSSFYEAAMAIADSSCVVVDENAISLNVIKTLMNYVTSKCSVFIVGNKDYNHHIEDINMITMSPQKFIEKLLFQIK